MEMRYLRKAEGRLCESQLADMEWLAGFPKFHLVQLVVGPLHWSVIFHVYFSRNQNEKQTTLVTLDESPKMNIDATSVNNSSEILNRFAYISLRPNEYNFFSW